jgi:hypothetical protein
MLILLVTLATAELGWPLQKIRKSGKSRVEKTKDLQNMHAQACVQAICIFLLLLVSFFKNKHRI